MKFKSEVIRGKPIEVQGRQLTPVARQTTGLSRRATIGSDTMSARGGGLVHLKPLGLVEKSSAGERFIPIPDHNAQDMLGLLAAALVVPALLTLALRLARR